MSKTIEIPDIAQWEETDSELAKKNILKLSSSIKYHIDFNKKLIDEINRLEMTIDIKNKRIDELNKRLDKKGKRIDKIVKWLENDITYHEQDDFVEIPYSIFKENNETMIKILRGKK